MNKESIYQLIGYRGEYTESVKKALRKLLKENHPDHQGNSEVFKIINEVKKELETNQVSFNYNKEKKETPLDDIDYHYCQEMIDTLEKKIAFLKMKINLLQEKMQEMDKNYRMMYRESIDEAGKILDTKGETEKLKKIKKMTFILLIILILVFIVGLIKKSILILVLFGILCFFAIMIVEKYFLIFQNIGKQSNEKVKKYLDVINNIQLINEKKEKMLEERLELEFQVNKMENDLRFYQNLLK